MFSTDFIFRQQENLVYNQKYQAGFRPLCNKILKLKGGRQFTERLSCKHFYSRLAHQCAVGFCKASSMFFRLLSGLI